VTWLSRAGIVLLGLGLVAGAVTAAGAQNFEIEVMVSQVSDAPGGIDPRGAELDAKLQKEFRYQSLKVLDSRRLELGLDEVGTLSLPNGKPLRVRPLQLTDRGLLLAARVGDIQTDLKLTRGHLVVIDAGRHGDGKLVVSFEASW
jgi:hypothetical protein